MKTNKKKSFVVATVAAAALAGVSYTNANEAKAADENSENLISNVEEVTSSNSEVVSATAENKEGLSEGVNKEEMTTNPVAVANLEKLNADVKDLIKEAKWNDDQISALTEKQITALNKMKNPETDVPGTKMTYKDFEGIAKELVDQNPRYAIPFFNAKKIENMKAATTRSAQIDKVQDLDVWDSWAVQNPRTKLVENWNGYQLAVAMMGVPGVNDNHLYLVYNKYGDNNLQNWKNAGSIFGYNLDEKIQQWSGSAIVNSDKSIQLFYTKVDTTDGGTNHQKIASITLNLGHDDKEVWIKSTENDQVIFEGDGYHYQTYDQWKATNRGADNIAMRDAHIVEEADGSRYLVFEASTGTENYQGEHNIYDWSNYGGDADFKLKSVLQIIGNEDITSRATWANAALGIIKITNDEKKPQVEKVYSPLITANMVSDEIERPSVVKLEGKYYLFAASRLNRGSNDDAWYAANKAVGDNVVMVGYVSDNLLSGYKPLNNSGVVLTASVPADWRTATYSYYAVPVEGASDRVLITSYMTNRHGVAGEENKATWGPSFLVQILPNGTTQVLAKMTEQGDWIWDKASESKDMLGNIDTARLPGEDYIVDWELIGYNLKDHNPHIEVTFMPDPPVYDIPEAKILDEPNTPKDEPIIPDEPNTPKDEPIIPNEPNMPKDEPVGPSEKIDKILPKTSSTTNSLAGAGFIAMIAAAVAARRKKYNK